MKDRFKFLLIPVFFILIFSGCGEDSTSRQAETQGNPVRRGNIPLLEESTRDKYLGFEVENEISLEDLKLDDEILNIPFDKSDNFYIVDSLRNTIRKYNINGSLMGDSGKTFADPVNVIVKDDSLFVLDQKRQIIFECDTDFNIKGRILEGKPVIERKGNYLLHIDRKSLMFLLNSDDGILEIFSPAFRKVREFRTSLSTRTVFYSSDDSRFVYAGDTLKGIISCFDLKSGETLFTIGEKGSELILPADFSLTVTDNRLFAVSPSENKVYIFDSQNGKYLEAFGSQGTGQGQFVEPCDIYSDSSLVFICEKKGHRVQVFDDKGNFLRNISSYGREPGKLLFPEMVFGIPELGFLFVLDSERKRLQCFDYNGGFIKHYTVISAEFTESFGVITDSGNNVFLVSPDGRRIINYSVDKMIENIPPDNMLASNITVNDKGSVIFVNREKLKIQINEADGRKLPLNYEISREKARNIEVVFNFFTMDSKKNIYVLDRYNHRIVRYDRNGKITASLGKNSDSDNDGRLDDGNGNGEFRNPYYINLDFNDNLYVADSGNYRIQKFNSDARFVKSFGGNGLGDGRFIGKFSFIISDDGTVIVSDYARSYIQLFDITGNFLSAFGKFGDSRNQFINPLGLGKDSSGKIYVLNSKSMDPFKNTDNLIIKKMNLTDLFSKAVSNYKKGLFQEAIPYFAEISKHRKDGKTLFYGWYSSVKTGDLENIEYFGKLLRQSTNLDEKIKNILKMEGFEL